ncbi:MAG: DUF4097 family beta strand repeat-containing protein [Gaiellaceae bacterium]
MTLDLHLPNGEIEVQAVEGEETVVSLLASSDRDEVRRAIEEARIELRSRGDGQVVVVDVEKRSRLLSFDRGEITLQVTAPLEAEVEISTASADIDLRGTLGGLKAQVASGDLRAQELNGRVDIKSASGDIELQVVGGEASISTASGDIYVRAVHGEATLRSASGDVQVDEAADSLTVQTASGDQSVGSVTAGRVVMQSASGDQQVGIRRGSRVHLDVKTLSGEASSELEVGDAPPAGDSPMVDLRATSMSGDIRVSRA